jgi:hypothetical protein
MIDGFGNSLGPSYHPTTMIEALAKGPWAKVSTPRRIENRFALEIHLLEIVPTSLLGPNLTRL